jgi:hypothetical protein
MLNFHRIVVTLFVLFILGMSLSFWFDRQELKECQVSGGSEVRHARVVKESVNGDRVIFYKKVCIK